MKLKTTKLLAFISSALTAYDYSQTFNSHAGTFPTTTESYQTPQHPPQHRQGCNPTSFNHPGTGIFHISTAQDPRVIPQQGQVYNLAQMYPQSTGTDLNTAYQALQHPWLHSQYNNKPQYIQLCLATLPIITGSYQVQQNYPQTVIGHSYTPFYQPSQIINNSRIDHGDKENFKYEPGSNPPQPNSENDGLHQDALIQTDQQYFQQLQGYKTIWHIQPKTEQHQATAAQDQQKPIDRNIKMESLDTNTTQTIFTPTTTLNMQLVSYPKLFLHFTPQDKIIKAENLTNLETSESNTHLDIFKNVNTIDSGNQFLKHAFPHGSTIYTYPSSQTVLSRSSTTNACLVYQNMPNIVRPVSIETIEKLFSIAKIAYLLISDVVTLHSPLINTSDFKKIRDNIQSKIIFFETKCPYDFIDIEANRIGKLLEWIEKFIGTNLNWSNFDYAVYGEEWKKKVEEVNEIYKRYIYVILIEIFDFDLEYVKVHNDRFPMPNSLDDVFS